MLNLLLLLFNSLDVFYLSSSHIPVGVSFADYVHQGVYLLIASILAAILIIMYFFRKNLNFYKKNEQLKGLAYLWVFQNAFLVFTTAQKNFLYIESYGLTHKRVGVYVFLLLTLLGLFTTFFKISSLKTNWYLFRRNTRAAYILMLLLSFVNWDRVITQYNFRFIQKTDWAYLTGLSDTNTLLLQEALYRKDLLISADEEEAIRHKTDQFLEKQASKSWKSWNYDEWVLEEKLTQAVENK